jgi:hypothetical protein
MTSRTGLLILVLPGYTLRSFEHVALPSLSCFRAHHHRDATSKCVARKLVNRMASCGASFTANNVIFEPRTVHHEIGRGAFREWTIRTHDENWNLASASGVGQTDNRGFVHAPALEMRQFEPSSDFLRTARERQWFRSQGLRMRDRCQNNDDQKSLR